MDSAICSLKILLIEDNRDFVFLLNAFLESLGHLCASAYDGIEGINKAREMKPDVIICDIGLPILNGFEVARQLRADDSQKETIIIALTGYAGQQDFDHAAEPGFNYHLTKPVSMAEIKKILDTTQNSFVRI